MTSAPPILARSNLRIRTLTARPFVRSVAGVAGANTLITVAGSVGGLVLARSLGPAARGDLVTIVLWPTTVGSIAALGTTEATCFLVARSKRSDSQPIVATSAAAAVATGLVVALAGLALAPLIARTTPVATLLRYVFALSPAYIGAGVMASALQARSTGRWNAARGMQPLVYLLGVCGLAAAGRLTLTSAVAAFCAGQLAQLLAGTLLVRRTLGPWSRPDPGRLRPLYGYGVRSWVASVPRIVNVRLDLLILSILPAVTSAALGNYAVAASLSWLALPLASAFGSVAFPSIAGAATEGDARRIERTSLRGATATAGVAMVVLAASASFVVPALFGPGFHDAVVALWLLAPGTVFLALNRVQGDLLRGRGHPIAVSSAEGIGALITLGLLLGLIPPLGINGAAIASSVAYASISVLLHRSLLRVRHAAAAAEVAGG